MMNFTKLVPNVFYVDIKDALKLFIDCLEFSIEHDELKSATPFCVIERNGLCVNLFENKALAKEHNPEITLVTDNIGEVYDKVSSSHPEFLHPNLSKITLRPCGAEEFALMDKQLALLFSNGKRMVITEEVPSHGKRHIARRMMQAERILNNIE
jgi:hypothetical protein